MRNTQANMVSFLGGLIVGAAIVALTTPRTGREVRESIRDFVDDGVDAVREKADHVKRGVKKFRNRMRDELAEKLESMAENCEC